MQSKSLISLVLSAALSLSLFGCVSGTSESIPEPNETQSETERKPAEPQNYSDISQLKKAFVEAGGLCDYWEQTNKVTSALQSGDCDSMTVLSLFSSNEAANAAALELKNLKVKIGGELTLLVGANWLINAPSVRDIQPTLGGLLILDNAVSGNDDRGAGQRENTWTISEGCRYFRVAIDGIKGIDVGIDALSGRATLDEFATQWFLDESLFRVLVPRIGDRVLAGLVEEVADSLGGVGRVTEAASDPGDNRIFDAIDGLVESLTAAENYCVSSD